MCFRLQKAADLAAEWDNFEKLIAGSSAGNQNYGSDKISTTSHLKPVTRKRVFKEDSNSDKSDSDDDQCTGFQKRTAASIEDRTKLDLASSSSSSDASPLNRLESDSDAHSNDSSDEEATSKKSSIVKRGQQ